MSNYNPDVIDPSLSAWAENFCQERKESIEYFLKFGSPIEKALVSKVVEIAGGRA